MSWAAFDEEFSEVGGGKPNLSRPHNATGSLARTRVEVEDENSGGERRVGIPVRKTNKDPSTEM